ncbi:MAG: arginase family protein [Candidatus Sulfotelmatobacter sp.]
MREYKTVDVTLIQVPFMMGDERQGKGPLRLMQAGAAKLVAAKGAAVNVARVDRGEPFRDSGDASLVVCKRLALVVRQAIDAGRVPLVLAGGCDASKGVLSGFDHTRCGVIWFDAHGDFNTPETTLTGYLPGMSLAVLAGHCYGSYWAQIGNSTPIPESVILLLGVRDLDPAESERLDHSAIEVVKWHDGQPQSDAQTALDRLAQRAPDVYLHIDMDSLDPEVAPGIVGTPVPGGISLEHMEDAIRSVFARFRVRAATLAVYDPEHDQDNKTLRTALRLIELLADGVKAQDHENKNVCRAEKVS